MILALQVSEKKLDKYKNLPNFCRNPVDKWTAFPINGPSYHRLEQMVGNTN